MSKKTRSKAAPKEAALGNVKSGWTTLSYRTETAALLEEITAIHQRRNPEPGNVSKAVALHRALVSHLRSLKDEEG